MGESARKITRILSLYTRLLEGETIYKADETNRFRIDGKTFQRDINEIRDFLSEQQTAGVGNRKLVYDREKQGYVMRECQMCDI